MMLRCQIALAEAQGDFALRFPDAIPIIIAADATPFWRTSATRCDVFVDVRATIRILFPWSNRIFSVCILNADLFIQMGQVVTFCGYSEYGPLAQNGSFFGKKSMGLKST